MPIKFPSEEWIEELCERLNASVEYAQAAANWAGDNIFIILPDANYHETTSLYINLQHGKASDPCLLKNPEEKKALFTTSAPFGTWRRVMEGKIDPLQGIFSGKLKLVGSMAQVQRNPKATYVLTKIASQIETDYGS